MSRRPWIAVFSAGLVALGTGCAQNAILELQVELPVAPPPVSAEAPNWFAQIQVRNRDGHPFNIPWMGGDIESVQLTNEVQWDCISVESGDDTLDLHVRVKFCNSDNCLEFEDGTDRERWYRLNHPFYIGRRTYHQIRVGEVPECDTSSDCGWGQCNAGRCSCATNADCPEDTVCETMGGNCLQVVDRCQIEGCIEGDSGEFCSDVTGLHFCETNDAISRDDTVACDVP